MTNNEKIEKMAQELWKDLKNNGSDFFYRASVYMYIYGVYPDVTLREALKIVFILQDLAENR